jgi:hypothetical protein
VAEALEGGDTALAAIPLPGPIPDIPLPGVPDWLNPFNWLNDQLRDLANDAIEKLQDLLMAIYGQSTNYWANMLYGESLGLAPILALAVMYFLLAMLVITRRYGKQFLESLFISIVIGAFGAYWFWLIDNLIRANIELTRGLKTVYEKLPQASGGSGKVELPDVVNTVASIAAFGTIALLAGILLLIFLIFTLEVMLAKLFGLLVLAVYPLGRRSKQVWNALVASTLVAAFLGPLLVFVTVESIIWVTNHGPGREENFIQSFYIIGGLLLAIVGVVAILVFAYIKTDEVAGKIQSKIHGDVNADARLKETVKTEDVERQSLNSMRVPAPVGSASGSRSDGVAADQPSYRPPYSKPATDSGGAQASPSSSTVAGNAKTASTAAASAAAPQVAVASAAQEELKRRRNAGANPGSDGPGSQPPQAPPGMGPKT